MTDFLFNFFYNTYLFVFILAISTMAILAVLGIRDIRNVQRMLNINLNLMDDPWRLISQCNECSVVPLKWEDALQDVECKICMSVLDNMMENVKLPCSHIFHFTCLHGWFEYRKHCPFCRIGCEKVLFASFKTL